MRIDITYILSFYPTDISMVKEFARINENTVYDNYAHMLKEYEDYIDSLKLTYIEDEV